MSVPLEKRRSRGGADEGRGALRASLPVHVAIIMDGNGRWALARGLTREAGHRSGARSVRTVVRTCRRIGVKYLTLYAFSTENWSRPRSEVTALMQLLHDYVLKEREELISKGIRLRIIGQVAKLPPYVRGLVAEVVRNSLRNDKMTLTIALSYGSREEIIRACRKLAGAVKAGRLRPEEIDEAAFENALYTKGMPPPDLLVRTSGEMRLSNFLLWQCAYTELYVTPTLWPDFKKSDLFEALREYGKRKRRFGLTDVQIFGEQSGGRAEEGGSRCSGRE